MQHNFLAYSPARMLSYGSGLFLGSNFVGHGIFGSPQPVNGLLVATAGMLICGLGVKRSKGSDWEGRVVRALGAVLTVAAFTLLPTLAFEVLRSCRDLYGLQWGATTPPGFLFGEIYGTISLCSLPLVTGTRG